MKLECESSHSSDLLEWSPISTAEFDGKLLIESHTRQSYYSQFRCTIELRLSDIFTMDSSRTVGERGYQYQRYVPPSTKKAPQPSQPAAPSVTRFDDEQSAPVQPQTVGARGYQYQRYVPPSTSKPSQPAQAPAPTVQRFDDDEESPRQPSPKRKLDGVEEENQSPEPKAKKAKKVKVKPEQEDKDRTDKKEKKEKKEKVKEKSEEEKALRKERKREKKEKKAKQGKSSPIPAIRTSLIMR